MLRLQEGVTKISTPVEILVEIVPRMDLVFSFTMALSALSEGTSGVRIAVSKSVTMEMWLAFIG
jgi:hypothetical protein